MKHARIISAALAALLSVSPAGAVPMIAPGAPPDLTVRAAGDCFGAGQRAAAQHGGQLVKAVPQGGSCLVVILVPGQNGGRPRRVELQVPPQ